MQELLGLLRDGRRREDGMEDEGKEERGGAGKEVIVSRVLSSVVSHKRLVQLQTDRVGSAVAAPNVLGIGGNLRRSSPTNSKEGSG